MAPSSKFKEMIKTRITTLKYRADLLKARFGADFSDDTETYDENFVDGG